MFSLCLKGIVPGNLYAERVHHHEPPVPTQELTRLKYEAFKDRAGRGPFCARRSAIRNVGCYRVDRVEGHVVAIRKHDSEPSLTVLLLVPFRPPRHLPAQVDSEGPHANDVGFEK